MRRRELAPFKKLASDFTVTWQFFSKRTIVLCMIMDQTPYPIFSLSFFPIFGDQNFSVGTNRPKVEFTLGDNKQRNFVRRGATRIDRIGSN
jgi:hypothetical protein